jgi:DNA-binding CsgD family transcriptional regulator
MTGPTAAYARELQTLLSSPDAETTQAALFASCIARDVAGAMFFSCREREPRREALQFHWFHDFSGQLGDTSPPDIAEVMLRKAPRWLFDWVTLRNNPLWLGRLDRYIPYTSALLLRSSAPAGKPQLRDLILVPYRHQGHCHLMFFGFHARADNTVMTELHTLALTYIAKWLTELVTEQQQTRAARGERLVLNERQLECLRWVIAGKSVQEVALITEMSYANVRYHLDRAKQQSGYASLQQLMVHAALEYGLSPLGPDDRQTSSSEKRSV